MVCSVLLYMLAQNFKVGFLRVFILVLATKVTVQYNVLHGRVAAALPCFTPLPILFLVYYNVIQWYTHVRIVFGCRAQKTALFRVLGAFGVVAPLMGATHVVAPFFWLYSHASKWVWVWVLRGFWGFARVGF